MISTISMINTLNRLQLSISVFISIIQSPHHNIASPAPLDRPTDSRTLSCLFCQIAHHRASIIRFMSSIKLILPSSVSPGSCYHSGAIRQTLVKTRLKRGFLFPPHFYKKHLKIHFRTHF